jgi:cytochrome c-type biogenesis protein CcmH/NrfG
MMRACFWLLLSISTGSWAATSSADADRCRAHGSIDACYDAIRRSPSDPALLTSLGDAFARANRTVDAVRTYRRAAALAPSDRGVAAKIAALEAKSSAKRVTVGPPLRSATAGGARRFSNAAPESQSH